MFRMPHSNFENKNLLDMHPTVSLCIIRNLLERFSVKLPRNIPPLSLGESKSIALKRYLRNKRSHSKKDQWEAFNLGLDEYRSLGHAELVPEAELLKPKSEVFFILVPAGHWRYVSTKMNLANLASRSLHIQQLLSCTLWWQGPEWLVLSSEDWPSRLDISLSRVLPELKSTVLLIQK